eukprot:6808873-Prymnesium_polylepis.2
MVPSATSRVGVKVVYATSRCVAVYDVSDHAAADAFGGGSAGVAAGESTHDAAIDGKPPSGGWLHLPELPHPAQSASVVHWLPQASPLSTLARRVGAEEPATPIRSSSGPSGCGCEELLHDGDELRRSPPLPTNSSAS